MNANELANLLEVDSWYKLVTREEIATMLRQQKAEIEHLKELFGCDPAYFEPDKKLDKYVEGFNAGKMFSELEFKEQIKNLETSLKNALLFIRKAQEK